MVLSHYLGVWQFPTKARKRLKYKNLLLVLFRSVTNKIPNLFILPFRARNTDIFFWFSSHCTFFRKHIKPKKNVVVAIIMHNTRAWGQWSIWGQWGFFLFNFWQMYYHYSNEGDCIPPIYLHLIFPILQFEISSLMNWIFLPAVACKIQVWNRPKINFIKLDISK